VVLRSKGPRSLRACLEEKALSRGVLAHPGTFYGFPGSDHLVISLLGRAEQFEKGLEILVGG